MLCVADAQQMCGQSRVMKIQLGRFDQAFAKVLVVWLEQEHHVPCLQHRKPGRYRLVRHAAVVPEAGHIQKLAAACGAQLEKALEQTQVLHLNELAHVTLDIGHQVVREPLGRLWADQNFGSG